MNTFLNSGWDLRRTGGTDPSPERLWHACQGLWCGQASSTLQTAQQTLHGIVWTAQVRYSQNHNLLRTVGFLAMICAVLLLANVSFCGNGMSESAEDPVFFCGEVRNIRSKGLLFVAPPCSSWVFLQLAIKCISHDNTCHKGSGNESWDNIWSSWSGRKEPLFGAGGILKVVNISQWSSPTSS